VIVAVPGQEFAFARSEKLAGTIAWRYQSRDRRADLRGGMKQTLERLLAIFDVDQTVV
jgi:hypothetical protein